MIEYIDKTVIDLYNSSFNTTPSVVARSPGRVEILGNHTDYNQGVALSAAIDKYLWIAMGRAESAKHTTLVSSYYKASACFGEFTRQHRHRWANYLIGVAALLKQEGYPIGPFYAAVHSTIPIGAGLSSSAALEVATGLALSRLFDFSIDKELLAAICQKAEHEFCGSHCGLLDQYSVLFAREAHFLYIDFRTMKHRPVVIPLSRPLAIAITPSGVTHSLGESAYNERRLECSCVAEFFSQTDPSVKALRDVTIDRLNEAQQSLHPVGYLRALHVVGENNRVERGIALLEAGDLTGFGQLLYASHESSRINFENSCRELDLLVDIAKKVPGVYGARLSGGGFGGAVITLLEPSAAPMLAETMASEFKRLTDRETSTHIVSIAGAAAVTAMRT